MKSETRHKTINDDMRSCGDSGFALRNAHINSASVSTLKILGAAVTQCIFEF